MEPSGRLLPEKLEGKALEVVCHKGAHERTFGEVEKYFR
jgi:hypothetical protein